MTSPNEEETAVLSMDEISATDRELVRPGAIFYWVIGYRDAEDGQRRSESVVLFKRPPPVEPEERAAALLKGKWLRGRVGDGGREQ